MITSLEVTYPPTYPDTLPNLKIIPIEGEIAPEELSHLLDGLKITGEESLGMAMVFTLVNWLKEELVHVLTERQRRAKEAEDKRFAEIEEVSAKMHEDIMTNTV